jgi:hypothetical protein
MSGTTYFGDVVTTGNTNIVQNFVSYGATSRFTSNILGNKSIGTSGAPFGNVFTTRSNTAITNTSTIQVQTILTGNVFASNAYQGGNLLATTMNVYGVSNTFLLTVRNPNVGIGTSGGANLIVQGNVYISNLTTTNVSVGLLNVYGTMNTQTLFTSELDNAVQPVPYPTSQTLTYFSPWDNFGNVVTISSDGSTMLTCANPTGSTAPTAFVYRFSGGSWVGPEMFIVPYGGPTPNGFGSSVALSANGNTALIGDPGASQAYLFRYSGGTWTAPGTFGYSISSGWAVSLSGDGNTLAVGSPFYALGEGSVAVYKYDGIGWNQYIITPPDGFKPFRPYFGWSIALSGDGNKIIVGTGNTSSQSLTGAFTFLWSGYSWGQISFLGGPPSQTAVSLSYDGSIYAIGFPDTPISQTGGVQTTYGYLDSPLGTGARFGASVSLSSDGNKIIIGAPNNTPSNKGYVASYTFSPYTGWSAPQELVYPASPPVNNYYGKSVAISGDGTLTVIGTQQRNTFSYQFLTLPYFSGANVNITGDAWVSNVILTQNVYTTTLNASTLTTTALTTVEIIDVGAGVSASTFEVQGNVFASNALVTQNLFANIYSTRANVRTMNATTVSVMGTALYTTVNVNTINVNSVYLATPTAFTAQGNLHSSNALSSTNLTVKNTIYYNEDLTKRSLYLQPNSTNARAIQSAISATCNASSKSYWCTSPAPVYGNVLSVSVTSNAYSGGVYLPDGRVVFVQSNCTNIGIFNPVTTAFTSVTGVQPGYNGGVLLPNGNVFFVPQNSNIGLFNPVTSKFSNTGQTLYGQSYNGVLAPEGVWLTPSKYSSSFGASQIALYNPSTNQAIYTIPTEELPNPVSVTAGSLVAQGVSVAWSSGIGKFVSITNTGTSYYSSDGTTWTLSTGTTLASIDPSCYWLAVAASTGLFVATGASGNFNAAYSSDGINWNAPSAFQNPRTINSTMAWGALTYNSVYGAFVSIGLGNISAGTNYALTPDGVTWYTQPSTGTIFTYKSLTTDSFGNQLAVSLGAGGAWYYAGVWSQYPPPGGGLTTLQDLGSQWNSVTYSSSLNIFVAVGSTEGGTRSGAAWAPAPPGAPSWSAASPSLASVEFFSEWTSVSWAAEANMFIAVGYNSGTSAGVGAYSRDGKSWYTLNPPISSLIGNKYITWSSSLKLWAIISGSGGIAPGSGYVYLAVDGYNTGSVLLPSGAIMFSPIGSANVMSFQQTYTYLVSNIVVGTDVFNGMVLAPDGNVITVPSGSNIYVINPTSGISTNVGPIAGSVTNLFRGGALLPSGNIVFAPGTSGNVGMFDPVALTYSNSIPMGTSGLAFSGATLLPSGQVVFTPYDSANVGVLDAFAPVSQEFCLAPYFNKF